MNRETAISKYRSENTMLDLIVNNQTEEVAMIIIRDMSGKTLRMVDLTAKS